MLGRPSRARVVFPPPAEAQSIWTDIWYRGRLRAQKNADGQWQTTPAGVKEYKATRHRREP